MSIGLELIGEPDVLILDEPTSGLDSVSAARVAEVLRRLANGDEDGSGSARGKKAVVASVHQPSSRVYHAFEKVVLMSAGKAVYVGPGGLEPARRFEERGFGYGVPREGFNVAEHLLEIASEYQGSDGIEGVAPGSSGGSGADSEPDPEKQEGTSGNIPVNESEKRGMGMLRPEGHRLRGSSRYATTFLTQFEALASREWKILCRYVFNINLIPLVSSLQVLCLIVTRAYFYFMLVSRASWVFSVVAFISRLALPSRDSSQELAVFSSW